MEFLNQLVLGKLSNYDKIILTANWKSMSGTIITLEKIQFTTMFKIKKDIYFVFGNISKEENIKDYEGFVYIEKDKTFRFMNFDNVKKNNFIKSITNYEDGHVLTVDINNTTNKILYLSEVL